MNKFTYYDADPNSAYRGSEIEIIEDRDDVTKVKLIDAPVSYWIESQHIDVNY